MSTQNPISDLVEQLSKLPGIGPKSAQRLAFFLLSIPTPDVKKMASVMVQTRESIQYCKICFNISLESTCHVCSNPQRDQTQVCVVSQPKDIFAIERTGEYKGVYHVLGGLISPIDGIHPELLRISELISRLYTESVKELVLAINPTIEGDATVLYLSHVLKEFPIPKTKLAYGLPVGSDLDYADELTLRKALIGRTQV